MSKKVVIALQNIIQRSKDQDVKAFAMMQESIRLANPTHFFKGLEMMGGYNQLTQIEKSNLCLFVGRLVKKLKPQRWMKHKDALMNFHDTVMVDVITTRYAHLFYPMFDCVLQSNHLDKEQEAYYLLNAFLKHDATSEKDKNFVLEYHVFNILLPYFYRYIPGPLNLKTCSINCMPLIELMVSIVTPEQLLTYIHTLPPSSINGKTSLSTWSCFEGLLPYFKEETALNDKLWHGAVGEPKIKIDQWIISSKAHIEKQLLEKEVAIMSNQHNRPDGHRKKMM